jgi:hypothetical protein
VPQVVSKKELKLFHHISPINESRGGQPFDQVGHIFSIKGLAGQKLASKMFDEPKRSILCGAL